MSWADTIVVVKMDKRMSLPQVKLAVSALVMMHVLYQRCIENVRDV